jgi:glycine cleavage system H lipoate-binding protein
MRPDADRTQPELPCVWVTAGVLNYRLCDREYECEGCPLYEALRGGASAEGTVAGALEAASVASSGVEDPVGRYLAELGTGCTLHLDRAYSAEGLWVECESSGMLRIGLDDYTQRLLQPIDDVVLPRVGVWLRHGASCAVVNRGRLAIGLRCPIAGEVVAVPPRPVRGPARSGERAEEPWWFRLDPHEPVARAAGLFRNEALLGWYLGRVRAVRSHLTAVMLPPEGHLGGPALADGGITTEDLEMVLGREHFESLVGTLFPLQI